MSSESTALIKELAQLDELLQLSFNRTLQAEVQNMPSAEDVWNILTDDNSNVQTLNIKQFTKSLENLNIHASIDQMTNIFYYVVYTNVKRNEQLNANSEVKIKKASKTTQNERNEYIKKKSVDQHMIYVMIGIIKKKVQIQELVVKPQELSFEKKYRVILSKIFKSLYENIEFSINDDYLIEDDIDFSNINQLLMILNETNREVWKPRKNCLLHIAQNVIGKEENNFFEKFQNEEIFSQLINGLTKQCTVSRSCISKLAIELFPQVLTKIFISNNNSPESICSLKKLFLSHFKQIFNSLVQVIKGNKSSGLSSAADRSIKIITNLLCSIADSIGDMFFYVDFIKHLCDNTNSKMMKTHQVRKVCIQYPIYMIYGLETCKMTEQKDEHQNQQQMYPSKQAIRGFLFKNDEFMKMFESMINQCSKDPNETVRENEKKVRKHIGNDYKFNIEDKQTIMKKPRKKLKKSKKKSHKKSKKSKKTLEDVNP
eukprot:493120_1